MGELKPFAKFTEQEAAFVEAYTDPKSDTYRNQTQSYISAGYYIAQIPEGVEDDGRAMKTAARRAHELIRRPHIAAEIEKRQGSMAKALQMSLDDVIAKFSTIAEADLSAFLNRAECECPHCGGDISDRVNEYQFDIEAMKKAGLGQLLKKMRPTKFGTEFEFHDAVDSLDKLMKHHGGYSKSQKDDLSAFDEVITLARKRQ